MMTALLSQIGLMLLLVAGAWALYWVVTGMFLDTYIDRKCTEPKGEAAKQPAPSDDTSHHIDSLAA